ncbi:ATPase, T2SS/T4P/T4SS family, partial [Acinetobacter baumannii]|uniref:ATPase, T2SS/T4P/T4SS family n=1 Tax=Acinetobacter baumannii TaxID=470 RepID=UPI001AECB6A3
KGSSYEFSYRYHHHIEPFKKIKKNQAEKIILYLKYQAGMDIAEKRKVQVGSATINGKEEKFRIRLSSVGDYLNQETLVIRFLYNADNKKDYDYIFPEQYEVLKQQVGKKGLYLFSGPTGAGKTTTMYELVKEMCQAEKKQIVTIEDPVEIECQNFLQFQVNKKIDLTYESLIKVCLRHRPDILIIGEIRDKKTAQMVIRAALTGHMVFSTI